MKYLVSFHAVNNNDANVKGGFYINAVSIKNAGDKSERILGKVFKSIESIGVCNSLSNNWIDTSCLSVMRGMNGDIKTICTDNASMMPQVNYIMRRGECEFATDLYESEVATIQHLLV